MKDKGVRFWELERFVLGDLPLSRMEEIRCQAENDPELMEKIASIERSNQDILNRYPAEDYVPKIMNRAKAKGFSIESTKRKRQAPWKRYLIATPALAAALVLLVVLFFRNGEPELGTRIKGEEAIDVTKTQVIIYRKTENAAEVLKNGDQAYPGDLLQIAYVPAGKSYGIIFSLDGSGVVTLHFPEQEGDSMLLGKEKKTLLQTSYELDDAPGFERFFFVASESIIETGEVLKSARLLAAHPEEGRYKDLKLPSTYDEFSVTLIKGEK